MKTEHPILFSGEMVRAILEGQKTMTRRVIKNYLDNRGLRWINGWEDWHGCPVKCPYGRPGDSLWVREVFSCFNSGGPDSIHASYVYRATEPDTNSWRWKPSIHMPRCASRLILEITDVWAERLQEITAKDAIAEGMRSYPGITYQHLNETEPINDFKRLWDSLNLKRGYGWGVNPFVWVISFRRIDK
jgi:hypothetical protein